MSPEAIAATAGVVLSLIFNYVPGLNSSFDRLSSNKQRLWMAIMLAATAVGMALWTCTDPDRGGLSLCLGDTNWRAVVAAFVFALIANQGVDRLSPKPRAREDVVAGAVEAVKAEKAEADTTSTTTTPPTPLSKKDSGWVDSDHP